MKKIIIITILFFVTIAAKAQLGNQYLQVINNPELINPSYQGGEKGADLLLMYGQRWTGFDGAPRSMGFNGRYGFEKLFGIGIRGDFEKMGHRTNTLIGVNADVDVRLSHSSYLNFGLFVGAELWRYSLQDALAGESGMVVGNFDKNNPVGGIGLTYRYKNLCLGASTYVAFEKKNDEKNVLNSYLHAEYNIPLPQNFAIRPMALFSCNSRLQNYWEVGAVASYRKFIELGASYRDNQGVNVLARVQLLDSILVGACYGVSTGDVADLSRSSFEVSIGFKFMKD